MSVDSTLSVFKRDARQRVLVSRGADLVMGILQRPAAPARRDSLLNGLQRLALESDDPNVRLDATNYFGTAGSWRQRISIVEGLRRIYQSRDSLRLRSMVLDKMPQQADRAAAVGFLRSVAAEPDLNGTDPIHGLFTNGDRRTQALARLSEMGEDGAAALRAMHRSGEAKSPQAKIILNDMARRGFPVRDLRRALSQQ
ncbi:hypothetical protein [Longimicrobium terrae]|uniref:HEAT repeat domain-containing protein n=1 Tax=Longimicrobium terrae TaxID=1639882 RepID=A0A841H338_9BACT|nr:hypothetical protein [Longimicrobium terrae]MBB4637772.1 hypothetical protein [Longimicrobium terrae]MBB6072372.1 hypothetical protein [Longimicrobium terrae]NNC31290.1 hypothetical protein [Longimicrobium terrae]